MIMIGPNRFTFLPAAKAEFMIFPQRRISKLRSIALACSFFAMVVGVTSAEEYSPSIAKKSSDGRLALKGFQIPDGMTGQLVAAEPDVANPVAFHIDEQGRMFVCETFRQEHGVEDNRSHMNWLLDDLALESVEERVAMIKKYLGDEAASYEEEHDRIRMLTDTNGDGTFDKSTVFADGFNSMATGTGAGVLAFNGDVLYACIPELWKLQDSDGDGVADKRKALHEGYGIRVAFRGHDMHGLTLGPDGRIYFSIGDRGYNVKTMEGRVLKRPDTGAVFRCEPDGRNLEVFAYGLRNPQELAFDDFGNLFTGENNSDSGDKARWVYVVEGGDTGWRMYFQYLTDRGPWNREHMWSPYREDDETKATQPAYIVPPIANLGDGPSGLTYYPGVGLPKKYDGHFFMADFRGTAGVSGIRSFANEPAGASFKLVDSKKFLWSTLTTDVDFGYDGGLYISDWVHGWDGVGKGRVYRFLHKDADAAAIANSQRIMKEGFEERSDNELVSLLANVDRRVRLYAQYQLAKRKNAGLVTNLALDTSTDQLSRIHAIWCFGQMLRDGVQSPVITGILQLAKDPDPEIRAQFARLVNDNVGDIRNGFCRTELNRVEIEILRKAMTKLLTDDSPRVQSLAALALGKIGFGNSIEPLVNLLKRNDDKDAVLRHTAVMGLAGIGKQDGAGKLATYASDEDASVRLGVLLAYRRMGDDRIVDFLNDKDPRLVVEAARAINDEPFEAGLPALADLASGKDLDDALVRRALNANFRLGEEKHATAVAAIAADENFDNSIRTEAITLLTKWNDPPQLDRVNGRWWPIKERKLDGIADIVRPHLETLFAGEESVVSSTVELLETHPIREAAASLAKLVRDEKTKSSLRVSALKAAYPMNQDREMLMAAVGSSSPEVRAIARQMFAKADPKGGLKALADVLEDGETLEKQSAIADLVSAKSREADDVLTAQFDKLLKGELPPATRLDIVNAVKARAENSSIAERMNSQLAALESAETGRAKDDPLAAYRVCLEGGDAAKGKTVYESEALSCRRCHMIDGGGGAVGPDLSGIGLEKSREYLLESIVDPNKQIAKGFETLVLVMDSGKIKSGILQEEKEDTLTMMVGEGITFIVEKDEIDERLTGQSGMPVNLIDNLSKSELRDLIEFLGTLKTPSADSETVSTKHE